ncbi:MAG: M23 family metallopeptidase [Paludibacteraceae bacterium]|nr:M23 family metallopeptidase [Paludibacteraceae bacterium]
MKKNHFKYNPETLSFEKIESSVANWVKVLFTHLLSGIGLSVIVLSLVYSLVDSPKERILKNEIATMEAKYRELSRRYDAMSDVMADLRERDNHLYRIILEADSMPEIMINENALTNDSYDEYMDLSSFDVIFEASARADYVEQLICQQSSSYDELVDLLHDKERRLQCIPAIQPILNRNLKQVASGFGWRIDPVFHTRRMHQGMDYSANRGTPVYATGDGTVSDCGYMQGYGNTVIINHGFGYSTMYAHLQAIKVKRGQRVTRAQVIGNVGSTGKSTGPHLHYEVHYHGTPVNPVNYYFLDLSPAEYDKMVQIAGNAGQVLD